MLRLEKALVVLDFESTGTNTEEDRIVQIAMQKLTPDGNRIQKKYLVNPEMEIPKQATDIHGITNEMVQDAPTFKQLSKGIASFIFGCDVAGYNSNRFDIPLLMAELARAEVQWPEEGDQPEYVDVYLIEKHVNSHKLTETYKRYTGLDLEDAHDAQADVGATIDVLMGQLKTFETPKSPAELAALCRKENQVDLAGKIILQDGVPIWTFGKHKNKPVTHDLQYCDWMLRADFSVDTKNHIKRILDEAKKEQL